MDKKAVLQKLKADISTYNDFSEIKYKTKYVSVFEAVFGQGNHFTTAANIIRLWSQRLCRNNVW